MNRPRGFDPICRGCIICQNSLDRFSRSAEMPGLIASRQSTLLKSDPVDRRTAWDRIVSFRPAWHNLSLFFCSPIFCRRCILYRFAWTNFLIALPIPSGIYWILVPCSRFRRPKRLRILFRFDHDKIHENRAAPHDWMRSHRHPVLRPSMPSKQRREHAPFVPSISLPGESESSLLAD